MKGHPHHKKMNAMSEFNSDHYERKYDNLEVANAKYTQGEMDNPEHLEKSNNALANYVKKNKIKY